MVNKLAFIEIAFHSICRRRKKKNIDLLKEGIGLMKKSRESDRKQHMKIIPWTLHKVFTVKAKSNSRTFFSFSGTFFIKVEKDFLVLKEINPVKYCLLKTKKAKKGLF